MWKNRIFRLSIPQRLLFLTILPTIGLIIVGAMTLRTHYSEYTKFAQDARALKVFQKEVGEFCALADVIGLERDAAMRYQIHHDDAGLLSDYRARMAVTDRAVTEFMAKLDRLDASPQAAVFLEKNKSIRSFFTSQTPEARGGALENRLSVGAVFYIYQKLAYSELGVSESHRLLIHTPAGLNVFDAIMAMEKIHLEEALVTSLILHGMANGGLQVDELAIVRRQFLVSTENEYYMLKFQPEIRGSFKSITRKTEDDAAYYTYQTDVACTQLERTKLPPFVPKAGTLAAMINRHFQSYAEVYDFAFSFGDKTLMDAARDRQRQAYTTGAFLLAGIGLSLGISLLITRSTRRSLVLVTQNIALASDDVKSASTQMAASGEQISKDAMHYAAAIDQISTSLGKVTAAAGANKDQAVQATATTVRVRDSVEAGLGTIKELDTVMNSARDSAHKINKIIARINDLSFQTNLLALNAAVEAARAGEAGAGFAVVAEEVGRLAGRCADAAKETADLIGHSAKDTATAMVKSDELSSRFKSVSLSIHEISEIVAKISASFMEQATSIGTIDRAVSDQREIAQSMAAAAEETASTAFSMDQQVESLRSSVDRMDNLLGATHSRNIETAEGGPQFPTDSPLHQAASYRG